MNLPPIIHEIATLDHAPPGLMDRLWALGWRHFGSEFFRYSIMPGEDGGILTVQPLRMSLADFTLGKSHRRVLRKNQDVEIRVAPAVVDDEREAMFLRHRERFVANVPDSLRNFIPSPRPHAEPCACVSIEVRLGGKLVAVSYLDVDIGSVSSVYAIFDPDESPRSLGTLTLLEEIRWAKAMGKRWLYPGYATEQPSAYDYKKSFPPLQYFDWSGNWRPLG
jgi:arginine-tRNA-protein transferase